ncbi:MAG: HlyC/CorC family transporter [Chloroflexi bacterium]|nr:HlyC/CorC family transporter [Chloroflexota bacterium]
METLFGLAAVLALVLMNGFFVAAEFAFVGARKTRITQLASEGNAGARAAEHAIEHMDGYIAATQLGITLASLALGWIGEPAIGHIFEALFESALPEEAAHAVGASIAVTLAFSLVTTLHIVLGELAPKSIALQRPEATAIIVARPTTWFMRLFRPVIWLMNGIGNGVVRLIGFEPASGHEQVHSAAELEMLVHHSHEAGLVDENEERLIMRVFDFGDLSVREVMQPRVEVQALPVDVALPDLVRHVVEHHHSRYPVFEESIDHVVGVLHTKDLLDLVLKQPELLTQPASAFSFRDVLREPLFVPATVAADRVLDEMRRTRTHLAIVLDEFGGMAGLVTMEDVLEELVGEMQDEFDDDTEVTDLGADEAAFDGRVTLTEIVERFGQLEKEPQSTTVGGYVAEYLGRIPRAGDRALYGRYTVVVDEMDGLRVARVRFLPRDGATLPPGDPAR